MSSNVPPAGPSRRRAERDARDLRRGDIARLYQEGVRVDEIARRVGCAGDEIALEVSRMRADGWDLPYRYGAYERLRVNA